MFDLSLPKLLVLTVIALVIFGPDKLPTIAAQAGRALRDLRQIAEDAKNDLREGLGPEFAGFEIEDLSPRRLVHKHPSGDLNADHGAQQQPARQPAPNGHASHTGRTPAVRPERDLTREFLNAWGAPPQTVSHRSFGIKDLNTERAVATPARPPCPGGGVGQLGAREARGAAGRA